MKNEDTLDRLIDVGADSLARALLHLAQRHEDAAAAVERLVSKPEARLTSFRQLVREITRLTERGGYIDWRETRAFANELEDALLALRDAAPDPKLGVELTVDFLEKGQKLIESCDDSDGLVADVYRYDSIELFVQYARDCSDARWLADLTVRLIRDDEYGLNERLIDRAFEYLPEKQVRELVDRFLDLANSDPVNEFTWYRCVESLARQLHDPGLFERTRRLTSRDLGTAACLDIGEVYFDSGDPKTALDWFNKAPDDPTFMLDRKYKLLLSAYLMLGSDEEAAEIALKQFHHQRQSENLSILLNLVGEEHRSSILDDAASQIMDEPELRLNDLVFLIDQTRVANAEEYVLNRASQINVRDYYSLNPIAAGLAELSLYLPATLIYRALLDDLLRRGYSRAYDHGVCYLRSLDRLATGISDWRNHQTHDTYFAGLKAKHGRKYSFWNRYDDILRPE